MNYFLFKLSFHTPCHFGSSDSALSLYTSEDHFCADTLFSALCHTARTLYGNSGVEALIEKAQKDQLFLSDAMPWCGERYYLPRPFLTARTDGHTAGADRKAMKNLAYIAVEDMADYLACMRGQGLFDAGRKKQCFGVPMDSTRAAVFEGQDTLPYHVGAFRFAEDCGLYVLAGLESDDAAWLRTLMRALGLSGIGGKVSSGYGKFTVDDEIYLNDPFDEQTAWLFRALCRDAPAYLLLTTALPDEEELERTMEDASYTLTRRGGFVSSDSFAPSGQKKREQFFLTAGSVVRRRFGGALYLAARQDHPVYRFSKPLLLRVSV
jgi:CRISPR-associated protein Csm4